MHEEKKEVRDSKKQKMMKDLEQVNNEKVVHKPYRWSEIMIIRLTDLKYEIGKESYKNLR